MARNSLVVLLSFLSCFLPGVALAEPQPLRIVGEIFVDFPKVDQAVMREYRHGRITHITYHHEGFAGTDADLFRRASAARAKQSISQRLRNIHHDHANNAGLGMIAYHYAVDRAGQIANGRPVTFKPATKSTVWGSAQRADFAGHFAVVVLGDFNHEPLTTAARQSLVRVMSEAQRAYRVPTARIQPHLDHANTTCPGLHIMEEAMSLPQRVLSHSLQAELALRGCLADAPDGVWGRRSAQALTRWSRAKGGSKRAANDETLFDMLDNPNVRCR